MKDFMTKLHNLEPARHWLDKFFDALELMDVETLDELEVISPEVLFFFCQLCPIMIMDFYVHVVQAVDEIHTAYDSGAGESQNDNTIVATNRGIVVGVTEPLYVVQIALTDGLSPGTAKGEIHILRIPLQTIKQSVCISAGMTNKQRNKKKYHQIDGDANANIFDFEVGTAFGIGWLWQGWVALAIRWSRGAGSRRREGDGGYGSVTFVVSSQIAFDASMKAERRVWSDDPRAVGKRALRRWRRTRAANVMMGSIRGKRTDG
ncbi:hypothetical protein BJ138DRAFT_1106830 [Hygrophoropsis aurantiaca]|uniref:Uncharacterized protein n=1 Tax=Hygrophoropsis aurantiaca TaxID=72124 RepID=A0ACB7ZTN7_9AGAM|nr:hypothetical protein BJ138DRAFT_1106830 [Hygrophoropsis aurantiaca]